MNKGQLGVIVGGAVSSVIWIGIGWYASRHSYKQGFNDGAEIGIDMGKIYGGLEIKKILDEDHEEWKNLIKREQKSPNKGSFVFQNSHRLCFYKR